MKTMRMWQMTVMTPMVLVLAGAGQVQADFSFGEPVNLGSTINSSDYEYDPDIAADGLELYFQSPRPGGYGDFDLYVDGFNVTQDEQNNIHGKQNGLYFGAGTTLDAASFFSGLIDDIRIYDVALRTEQIEAIAR